MLNQALLLLFVLLANSVETITGFGGVIIALTLGAQLFPVDFLVVSLAPVNTLLSAYIVARHHIHIDHAELWKRIIPFALCGLIIGIVIAHYAKSDFLTLAYGVFVLLFSVTELIRVSAKRTMDSRPQPSGFSIKKGFPWLMAGGVIHGIYLSGGPLIVYYATRAIADKSRFRSTLSAMWLLLNVAVLIGHIFSGQTNTATLTQSALLLPALAAGIVIGEYFHHRINERTFRRFVFSVLVLAGASLTVKAMLLISR